eukprot:CAMPEP_0198129816 /NCGR_PEP_ID=MMETSP1442-20131203/52556_1 /TAXON_ID= /ORGANISM="Craspedostauros australis, Strain CCMP3328" /LENGTH=340 /DNA_ID=CAMNT_0043790287 /DNA_START=287 /DNA_END=1309 /DNA_ORIENTATION=+
MAAIGSWAELTPPTFDAGVKDAKSVPKQMYKNEDFKAAVMDAWAAELSATDDVQQVETASIVYSSSESPTNSSGGCGDPITTPLYGHLVRRCKPSSSDTDDGSGAKSVQSSSTNPNIGALFFHTAAGPHDAFLLWKAASLLQHVDCTILICDLFSDESGWGWDPDRSRYQKVREHLFAGANDDAPHVLQQRVAAACDTIQNGRKDMKIAALGWCFGGHPILQLGKMNLPNLHAMVTFHGVFDTRLATMKQSDVSQESKTSQAAVLLCHGEQDPFVALADVELSAKSLESHGHRVRVLELKDAMHGYTNPAQDLNPNPSFAYQAEGANRAWADAVEVLKSI